VNISDIVEAGKEVIFLLSRYSNAPHREMKIDPALFGYLRGKHGPVDRQHPVHLYGGKQGKRAKRIDYRLGGSNPVVLEFAVRPPTGGGTLLGSQNASELRKLCRVSDTEARLRALLLVDLYREPHDIDSLWDTYDRVSTGPGRYKRSGVRVIYVHAQLSSPHYIWRPWRH
jgi:hypothetical protein